VPPASAPSPASSDDRLRTPGRDAHDEAGSNHSGYALLWTLIFDVFVTPLHVAGTCVIGFLATMAVPVNPTGIAVLTVTTTVHLLRPVVVFIERATVLLLLVIPIITLSVPVAAVVVHEVYVSEPPVVTHFMDSVIVAVGLKLAVSEGLVAEAAARPVLNAINPLVGTSSAAVTPRARVNLDPIRLSLFPNFNDGVVPQRFAAGTEFHQVMAVSSTSTTGGLSGF